MSQTFGIQGGKKVKFKQVPASKSALQTLASGLMTRIWPESTPARGYRNERGLSGRFRLSTDPGGSREGSFNPGAKLAEHTLNAEDPETAKAGSPASQRGGKS